MKIIYSHTKTGQDGKKHGSKLLKIHIEGVSNKARSLYSPVNLEARLQIILDDITKYHDLGKYTPHFQNYLLESGSFDSQFKQHSKFGAFALFEKYQQENRLFDAFLACYIIVHHHSNLSNFSLLKRLSEEDGDDNYIFEEQWKSIKKQGDDYLKMIVNEINEPRLQSFIKFPQSKTFLNKLKEFVINNSKIEVFFLINYLFSILIEADKLDASDTAVYQRQTLSVEAIDIYLKEKTSNPLRTQVRRNVIEKLLNCNLHKQKIFTLTAPTGVGKTFTALDVALKLRHHVASLKNAQIIYALPFINIIEQGLDEYQKAIGNEASILAHYQYADVFGEEKRSKMDWLNDEEKDYNKKVMELDTWQSDIIITSFVQFFQTLIGYKNKLLKKFSHYANAIVILDEVQTLKLSQLPLLGAMLYYLSKYLNTYIILMTATKPKILELAYNEILKEEGEPPIDFESLELLHDHTNIYESYKRTKIIPLITNELQMSENPEFEFIKLYFSKKWTISQSCLIVVNKVNRCIDLYDAVKEYLKEKRLSNPIYCLSTNIIPAQRFEIIKQIKTDLKQKKSPILIATQVVEAGVDLNFDMGFRDIGPIDSIVQVAGRINREAIPQKPENPYLPLFIVDFGDCKKIYGLPTYAQAQKALTGKSEFLESEYLTLVESYFTGIADKSSFDESKKLFEAIKNLRYDGEKSQKWDFVSDFAIIEENDNTVSVFVLADVRAEQVKEAYELLISKKLSKEKFDKEFKRDFHQRIIAVPKYYTNHLEVFNNKLNIDYLKIANSEHYNTETGFIRISSNNNYIPPVML